MPIQPISPFLRVGTDSIAVGASAYLGESPAEIVERVRQQKLGGGEKAKKLPAETLSTDNAGAAGAEVDTTSITTAAAVGEDAFPGLVIDTVGGVAVPHMKNADFSTATLVTSPYDAGTPQEYNLRADDVVSCGLLSCLLLTLVVFARSRQYVKRTLSAFFAPYTQSDDTGERTEGEASEVVFLVLQLCFAGSVLFFDILDPDADVRSPYVVMGAAAGSVLAMILAKLGVYALVNGTFFPREKNARWRDAYVSSLCLLSLATLALALVLVYLDAPPLWRNVFQVATLVAVKIGLFFKCRRIFFSYQGGYVHLFLYFCTLEIVPLLMLWRGLFWASSLF